MHTFGMIPFPTVIAGNCPVLPGYWNLGVLGPGLDSVSAAWMINKKLIYKKVWSLLRLMLGILNFS